MKKLLTILAVLIAFILPVVAQYDNDHDRDDRGYGRRGDRMSSEDQAKFDSYFSRWQDYRRTNNREQIESMEKRMRGLMSRYHIPLDVPFERVASGGDRGWGGGYRERRGNRLSSEDQAKFDSYYSRWLEYRRTNNRHEIDSMEKRMRGLMDRYNIPLGVPFDEVASRR